MQLRRRILIVDDQPVNHQILSAILREEYTILIAQDGRQALQLLRQEHEGITAVLLDLYMPQMDGFEVLAHIQADPALHNIPVLVTTAHDEEAAEVRALSMGAFDYLTKPYRPEAIRRRVANAIQLRESAALVRRFERDELTGLLNRQAFYDRARRFLTSQPDRQFDLVCADIERFKLINDLFGVHTGDQLLRQFASFFADDVSGRGICGRLVSDILVAIVPRPKMYTKESFTAMMDRLNVSPISIPVYVRFGIYEITDRSVPTDVMCDRARLAADSIKGKYGVYYVRYDDSIRQQMLYEQDISSSMKPALEKGQFHVHYQPKYEIASGGIAGAEALVRWYHPEKGMIAPSRFIPLFERNGFITDLDLYVWETVCRQMREWIDTGVPVVPVSVNISRVDLYHRDLANRLLELADRYHIDLNLLHLEITETAYTQDPDQLIATVNRLKVLGFVIEMDDFGSGYSSLNMLSALPIDVLKLDLKFLQNTAGGSSRDGILNFIIGLARWRNLLVVAEGVESGEQVQALRELHCNYAQGFCYAKPMPATEFCGLLESSEIAVMHELPPVEDLPQRLESLDASAVLVASRDGAMRTKLSEVLEGCVVIQTPDGMEVLNLLEHHCPQIAIVLLDLDVAGIEAVALLRRLRGNAAACRVPVVVISRWGRGQEAAALEAGAVDFVQLSCDEQVLRLRVKNALAKRE